MFSPPQGTTPAYAAAAAPPANSAPLPAFNRVRECRYGRMLYNVNDEYVGRSFDLYGEYGEGEAALFRQILRPGDVVLDVGANIGAHTLFFARAVGTRGVVLAFEPQRLSFQTLCANMALNDVPHAWCYHMALSDAPGAVVVPTLSPYHVYNFGGFEVGRHPQGEPVPVARADSFPLTRCRLIKVDVEGMELAVLKGAAGLVERFRPALYVENDRPDKAAPLLQHIDSLGYEIYRHHTLLFNPNNHARNPQNVFGNIVSANLYCLPREAAKDLQGFERVDVPPVGGGGGVVG